MSFNSPRLDQTDKITVRNYFMNSSLRYFQRSFSQLISNGAFEYVADRFLVGPGLDGVAGSQTTYSRSSDVPDSEADYSLQATGSYVPDEEFSFIQRVESIFSKDLSNGKVSLRFFYKSDGCDQIKVKLQEPNSVDNHSATTIRYFQTFNITNDNTWQEFVLEDIDVASLNNGLQFHIVFISDVTGTATVNFAKPQLNLGEKILPYSLFGRDIIEELWWCQRYFEKSYDVDVRVGINDVFNGMHIGLSGSNQDVRERVEFKVRKRVVPTCTPINPNTLDSYNAYIALSVGVRTGTAIEVGQTGFVMSPGQLSGLANTPIQFHWTADAEL
jgi:hypothetical protein